tara:strand:+ start:705 stop:3929 length:3225 start_codon:yes stop_codon:yes gene_type:complete
MALTSPGVEVKVIDESFYTPAEPGTVPMIFVASAQNKTNASGTGVAQGTLKANAGKPYLITSQRDLADTFGDPLFYTDTNNNPIHGGELNEYGLQTAYSYLGVANRVYVVRADIDLAELQASASAPGGTPVDGTYWFDTRNTAFGIFEWNGAARSTTGGQTFGVKTPIVITEVSKVTGSVTAPGAPKGSVGAIGDYAVVAVSALNKIWYKNSSGVWVEVGTDDWQDSVPVVEFLVSGSTPIGFNIGIDGSTYPVTGTSATTLVSAINASVLGASGVIRAAASGSMLYVYSSTGEDVVIDSSDAAAIIVDGTYNAPAVEIASHTLVPTWTTGASARPTGSVWIKTTEPNSGAKWSLKQYNATTKLWADIAAPLYANNQSAIFGLDRSGGGVNISVGTTYVQYNTGEVAQKEANFKLKMRQVIGATSVTSSVVASTGLTGSLSFDISESLKGQAAMSTAVTVTATYAGDVTDAETLANAINAKGLVNVTATVDAQDRVVISHAAGGEIRFTDTDGVLNGVGFYLDATANLYAFTDDNSVDYLDASNWKVLSYTASNAAPSALTADGGLWYNSIVDEVDMLVHNGSAWVGRTHGTSGLSGVDLPIISATVPTKQSDGTTALVDGDIWIDTGDLENFPTVYRYDTTMPTPTGWVLLDSADQTTQNGVLFADARWSDAGANSAAATIEALSKSAYLDPDAPDYALYPRGMLLWNLRRSGFNVKRFERNYIDTTATNGNAGDESMAAYYPHRWVTESANNVDGSGSFGRNAQRKVVVQRLQAIVNSNDEIRDDESRLFNLMATPGYPELIGEMITLNYDRGLTAFIVGDSPMRLTPDATSLNEWGSNVNSAVEDNDQGLVSSDEYLGMFYPSGYSSDNFGNNIVVPASHMMLRTMALSDQVSYPWFAPAGTRRGGITNATSTGYVSSEGEFVAVALNEGQRDTLYSNNVNPVTFITGAGLVNFGQKTRARNASALDRINVARLVIYLRSQLNRLAKPYIFEPNDKVTRDDIKSAAESLMLELVGLRALNDYLVVCDESNNTPARIDRNELYLDIAIEPIKAVEFIYIPLRLKNTGEIAGL